MVKNPSIRSLLILPCLLIPSGLFSASESVSTVTDTQTGYETTILPDTNDSYPGCMFKGNYVYAGAINLVWNDIKQNITGEDLKFKTADRRILHFINLMNVYPFTRNDLDSESYYIKSGFGQKTEDIINREIIAKFPDKSFPKLDYRLNQFDIIGYAYIYKNIQFLNKFEPCHGCYFGKQRVMGFWASTKLQKMGVDILHYWTDDKFIIKLRLKNPGDELIIAKGFDQKNPLEIMTALKTEDLTKTTGLEECDQFEMPELHLNNSWIFNEMTNLKFNMNKWKNHKIGIIYEKVKYDLDYNGVRLENEAALAAPKGDPCEYKAGRSLILNKSFWVIMKRRDSWSPYFILGVNNAEIMKKIQKSNQKNYDSSYIMLQKYLNKKI